jgi:hypothetical protein
MDIAASALGGAADKGGYDIDADLVVYNNAILRIPSLTTFLPTLTGDGVAGAVGVKYVNYGSYATTGHTYDRAATFPGCVAGFEVTTDPVSGTAITVPFSGTIMDLVFGNEPFSDDDVNAFAQRAADSEAVGTFVHDHIVTAVDHIGESGLCPIP